MCLPSELPVNLPQALAVCDCTGNRNIGVFILRPWACTRGVLFLYVLLRYHIEKCPDNKRTAQ